MKKIIFSLLLLSVTFISKSYAQDSTDQHQLAQLLTQYYSIKDALVAGNGADASARAEAFIKTANSIDYKVVSEGNVNALLKDATAISGTKDIARQRTSFARLSDNMASLAKGVKLSSGPIYQLYCPMKKSSWLSAETEIKNPYFGSSMLSCGQVTQTIQ